MTMRIANISTAGAALAPRFIGAGFTVETVDVRIPIFPYNQIDHQLKTLSYVDALLRAEKAGCNAAYINTVGDYGMMAARSHTKMLIVGAGQATMHAAAQAGRRFSIVTIWPPATGYLYDGLIRQYGFERQCVSVRHVVSDAYLGQVQAEDNFVKKMQAGASAMLDLIAGECHKAIVEDGADTVMLGCTCMAPIADRIQERCPFPVLDAMRTGYKMTEMLLSLKLTQSGIAYHQVPRDSAPAYNAAVLAAAPLVNPTDCPACAVTVALAAE
jgi:allantoin racemase